MCLEFTQYLCNVCRFISIIERELSLYNYLYSGVGRVLVCAPDQLSSIIMLNIPITNELYYCWAFDIRIAKGQQYNWRQMF